MNSNINFYFGIFLFIAGIVMLMARIFRIEKMFWKLQKMKDFWGEKPGSVIHFIFYVIIPILAGTILIIANI